MGLSYMCKSYLYVRKAEIDGTRVWETTRKNAIDIIRANRRTGYEIGILGGRSLEVIRSVYGEFAPFIELHSEEELLKLIRQ